MLLEWIVARFLEVGQSFLDVFGFATGGGAAGSPAPGAGTDFTSAFALARAFDAVLPIHEILLFGFQAFSLYFVLWAITATRATKQLVLPWG